MLRNQDTVPLRAPPPALQATVQNVPDELGSYHGYSSGDLHSQMALKYQPYEKNQPKV